MIAKRELDEKYKKLKLKRDLIEQCHDTIQEILDTFDEHLNERTDLEILLSFGATQSYPNKDFGDGQLYLSVPYIGWENTEKKEIFLDALKEYCSIEDKSPSKFWIVTLK